ncbi:porin [Variovorax sp. JS1663]|uniref:porin n=1 Tax=Variovorax sp. JS1663 TaxID=1851577 RepID=UPI000B34A094|nr:porin [Variovorax sp. JS1663]OUL99774.1 porin [Variovorax sp. JS1663]
MRTSLITFAALAASGAASAQSSVTLFGVADSAISHYSVKSSFYNNTGALPPLSALAVPEAKRSQTALSSGANASSRVGFRGTEDLGGGLAAGFWLESGITQDSGATALAAFSRRSTVSLSGGFGELRLGRDYVPTYWNESVFDPMGAVGVGENLIKSISGNIATARGPGSAIAANDNAIRASNSVGYFLPRDLGGFYGQVMYALPENVKYSYLSDSPSQRGRYYGGRFGYASGPLDVAVAYGQSTAADTLVISETGVVAGTRLSEKLRTINLGASYDFGVLKLMGELSQVKDKAETTTAPLSAGRLTFKDNDEYHGAMIGMTVPVGAGVVKASYARVKFKNDLGSAAPTLLALNRDASVNKLALGYVHNLSKRTALYATVARARIKNGQNNPAIMAVGLGGPAFLSTGSGVAGLAPRSATGYDFGLRHAF